MIRIYTFIKFFRVLDTTNTKKKRRRRRKLVQILHMNVYLWIFPLAIWIPPCILNLSNNGKIFHNLLKVYLGWKQRIKWYFCVLIVPQVAMEIKNSVCFDGGLNCQALLLGCKTWLIFSKKSKKRFKYIVIKLLYFWNKNVMFITCFQNMENIC